MKQTEKKLKKLMNNLADFLGHPKVFIGVVIIVVAWFIARLFIDYQVWFDILDLSIFISTFLLLFVIQSSQNADTKAIQDKLDEIINSLPQADKRKKAEEMRIKRGDKK